MTCCVNKTSLAICYNKINALAWHYEHNINDPIERYGINHALNRVMCALTAFLVNEDLFTKYGYHNKDEWTIAIKRLIKYMGSTFGIYPKIHYSTAHDLFDSIMNKPD